MRNLAIACTRYGWICEIFAANGMVLAHGFAGHNLPNAKALAVTRALAQL